jgi:hypothetical protein
LQNYYNYPKVQLANTSYDSNGYFVSHISSHVGVASCNDIRYVASADTFDNASYHTHGQESMSTLSSLNFDVTSNIQHVDHCLSAISSQYVVSPHDMPINERIGYDNTNYLVNCSQNSAPYVNALIHNSAPHVTSNLSRINENSVRYVSANTYYSTSRVISNHSRIKENSAPYAMINAHNSALYSAHDQS